MVAAEYLDARQRPYKQPWTPANKELIEDNLSRCLRGFGDLRAMIRL